MTLCFLKPFEWNCVLDHITNTQKGRVKEMNNMQDQSRSIAGVILVGLGGLFLFGQVTGVSIFGVGWPLFVLIPGVIFLTIALRNNHNEAIGLIFPGIIVTGTGLILSYQNITDHWESWAYIWALYPVMVGMALRYVGQHTNKSEPMQVGRGLMISGLVGFVALGALFELFIFNGVGFGVIAPMLPLVMIGAGLFMIFRTQSQSKAKRKSHDM